ncbi:MAG: response regulator [Desulfobacteraceae bacterium]|nr:MAG: response regulator [Desulfobacteraceae bacterium]
MGLSQVYGIIKEMKGDISVYSETGQGTTFKLLIPEQKPETSSMDEVIPEVMVTGKGRLMVVDDEPSIVDWCTQVLIKLGYQVEGFHYSRDALERFKHSPKDFDLVLTDLAMPDMSGLELSMEFRKCSPHIPIVVCTGFSEGLTREKLHIYGISNMVMKPLIASELSRVINSAINEFNPQEIDDDNGPGH